MRCFVIEAQRLYFLKFSNSHHVSSICISDPPFSLTVSHALFRYAAKEFHSGNSGSLYSGFVVSSFADWRFDLTIWRIWSSDNMFKFPFRGLGLASDWQLDR